MTLNPYKIWNSNRDKKVSVTASSLEELLQKGSTKLGLSGESATVVLEADGTEVDEEDYFSFLPPDTVFMFLVGAETWSKDSSRDEVDAAVFGTVFESSSSNNLLSDLSPLLFGLQKDLTRIVTLTDDQLQEIVDLDAEQLAQFFNGNVRFCQSLQDGCQRHLDHRAETKDARDLWKLYHQAQGGEEVRSGRKRRKI